MVHLNYISSPKCVPNQMDFVIWPLAYQGFEVVKVFEAFQHHQVTDKPDYWHFEKNLKWQRPPSCLCKDSDFCHAFYFMVSVCIPFWNTCINPTSRRPIESRTAPIATVSINATGVFDELHNIQQVYCARSGRWEPVIVYICTPIGLFANTLYYGGATF